MSFIARFTDMNNTSAKKSPLKFFILVFALSIPLWIIATMIDVKGLPFDVPVTDVLATSIPLISACILVYKEERGSGVKKLLKRIVDFPGIKQRGWYVVIILLPFVMYLLIYIVISCMALPLPEKLHIPSTIFSVALCTFFSRCEPDESQLLIW